MTDPILHDLTLHLTERMVKVIDDYLDRLQQSGRTYRRDEIAEALGFAVLHVAATAMRAKTQSTCDEFLAAARTAYQLHAERHSAP